MPVWRRYSTTDVFATIGVTALGAAVLFAPPITLPTDGITVSNAPLILKSAIADAVSHAGGLLVALATVNAGGHANALAADNPHGLLAHRLAAPTVTPSDGAQSAALGSGVDVGAEPGLVLAAYGAVGHGVAQALSTLPGKTVPGTPQVGGGFPLAGVPANPAELPAAAVSLSNDGVDFVQATMNAALPSADSILAPVRAPVTDVSGRIDSLQGVVANPLNLPVRAPQARGTTDMSHGNKATPLTKSTSVSRAFAPARSTAQNLGNQVDGIVSAVSATARSFAQPLGGGSSASD